MRTPPISFTAIARRKGVPAVTQKSKTRNTVAVAETRGAGIGVGGQSSAGPRGRPHIRRRPCSE